MAAWIPVRTENTETKHYDAEANLRVFGYPQESNQTQRLLTVALETNCTLGRHVACGPKADLIEEPISQFSGDA